MHEERVSGQWRAWLIAIRPHTLPAGIAPVLVGAGVAASEGVFAPGPALAALLGAVLIQIGTNFANDYYDAQRGVDTDDRDGFTRVTQAGLLSPTRVRRAMVATFVAAIVIGTYLVYVGGLPIVIVGLASVVCGVAYAGGPFPFGSYGLGDFVVFVFFGLVAVVGTYYVQAVAVLSDPLAFWIPTGTISVTAVIASLSMGGLSTAVLVVNNLRDIETDRAAGKYTLAVLVGRRGTKLEFVSLVTLAYLVPPWLVLAGAGWPVLLPLTTIPYAAWVSLDVIRESSGTDLNRTLTRTGRLLALYAGLLTLGLLFA